MKFRLASLAALITVTRALVQLPGVPFRSPVTVAPGYTARVIFSNITAPRGIAFDSKGNLLVVERGLGVTVFSPTNLGSVGGIGAWNREVVIKNANLTHGIQLEGNKLYVSTAKDVLLYSWDPVTQTVGTAAPYPVVDGLPADGGQSSRLSLEFLR
jgi:hypothetical protein